MKKKINILFDKTEDGFVGIKIIDNNIDFYIPQSYISNKEEISAVDKISILKTLSLSKTMIREDSTLFKDKDSENEDWTINEYLWIIRDFLSNGYYLETEKIYKNNVNGKINWKRTFKNDPIITSNGLFFDTIVNEKNISINNMIPNIYKECLQISIDRIGWIFGYDFQVEYEHFDKRTSLYYLKSALEKTFDDVKRLRLKCMISIINGLSDKSYISKKTSFGVYGYQYVFEKMIDDVFYNSKINNKVNINDFYPTVKWNGKKISTLRPDTILNVNDNIYIIDSKYYNYGVTNDIKDLPKSDSVVKQIAYAEYIENRKEVTSDIYNAFILPYNKEDNVLGLNQNIVAIGEYDSDWKKGSNKKYEKIVTILIDMKYLINTWINKKDPDTKKLINEIEKTIAKIEK